MSLGTRAFGALMADEKRAQRVTETFGAAQRGREAVEKAQGQILHTLGFASKDDYAELIRLAASLTDRLRELEKQVEHL
jgi:hypothetical protein